MTISLAMNTTKQSLRWNSLIPFLWNIDNLFGDLLLIMKLWSRIGSGRRRIVWRGFNTTNTLVIQAVAGWTIRCTGTYTLNRFLTPIHLSCSCLGIQDETCRNSWYLLKPSKYNSNLKERIILPSQDNMESYYLLMQRWRTW